jgi:hypothetical protein
MSKATQVAAYGLVHRHPNVFVGYPVCLWLHLNSSSVLVFACSKLPAASSDDLRHDLEGQMPATRVRPANGGKVRFPAIELMEMLRGASTAAMTGCTAASCGVVECLVRAARYLRVEDRSRGTVVIQRYENEIGIRNLCSFFGIPWTRPSIYMNAHGCTSDFTQSCVKRHLIADPDRAKKLHRLH